MGARQKLNGAHLTGNSILAGLAGALTGSWAVVVIGFTAMVIIDLTAGNIRSSDRKK